MSDFQFANEIRGASKKISQLTPEEVEFIELAKGFKRCAANREWVDKEYCESSGRGTGCKLIKDCPTYKSFLSQP